MSDKYDLVINQGEDEIRVFVVVDKNRTSVPLDNFSARMQIRPTKRSDVVLDELTTDNGRLVFTEKGLELHMSNEVTSAYSFCSGVYDIELVSPDNVVTRLVEGRVIIRHGVTR